MALKVEKYILSFIRTNTYIVYDDETKKALIVDPADNAKFLESKIREKQLVPEAILLTHGHFDHIMAAEELKNSFDVPVMAGDKEKELLNDSALNLSGVMGEYKLTLDADEYLTDNMTLSLLDRKIRVMESPGHTKGSICYIFPDDNIVFSGDTLFRESMGRTDFPTGSASQMKQSLKKLTTQLSDDMTVYAGHMEDTTIGHEKMYNPFIV